MLTFKQYISKINEAATAAPVYAGATQTAQPAQPAQTAQPANQSQINPNDPLVQNLKKKISTDPAVARAKTTGDENKVQQAVNDLIGKDPAASAKFGKQVDQSDRYIANAFRAMGAGRQQ
jgi:hypothetical protein